MQLDINTTDLSTTSLRIRKIPVYAVIGASSNNVDARVEILEANGMSRLYINENAVLLVPDHSKVQAQEVVDKIVRPEIAQRGPGEVFSDLWVRGAYENSMVSPAVLVLPDRVFLARGAIGVEFLWYRVAEGNNLYIASRPQELIDLNGQFSRATALSVVDWAYHGMTTPPNSPFDGISLVDLGEVVSWDALSGHVAHVARWQLAELQDSRLRNELSTLASESIEQRIEKELESAILRCIGSCETVGALVSGGVDSSLMAAIARRHAKLHAVTVSLPEAPKCDEARYARCVAESLDIKLYEYEFTQEKFRLALLPFVREHCLPVIGESSVALFACAREGVFQDCDLVLDGEGADTSYCGMTSTFRWEAASFALSNALCGMGALVPWGVEQIIKPLRRLGTPVSVDDGRHGLAVLLAAREFEKWREKRELEEMCIDHMDQKERSIICASMIRFSTKIVQEWWRLEIMANEIGVPVRMPFMEKNHLQLALNIPLSKSLGWDWWKMKPKLKMALKRVAAKHIPKGMVYRNKMGFSVPGAVWLPDWPEEWLANSWCAEAFGVSLRSIQRFVREERTSRDHFYLTTIEMFGRLYGWGVSYKELESQWHKACCRS